MITFRRIVCAIQFGALRQFHWIRIIQLRRGSLMRQIEMRDHCSDYEDLAEFWNRIWIPEYEGKTWVSVTDAGYCQWLAGPQSGAMCSAAYEGTKLVGSMFSVPHSLRVGSLVHAIGLTFGLTVDSAHRRLALPLVERLRRHSAERGIKFALGTVANDPTSPSHRFWTKYAEAFPQNLTFLFPVNYWGKVLAPLVLAKASVKPWERLASRALGPLSPLTPYQYDRHVRSYRTSDLERCGQILDKAAAGFDWALMWSPERLSHRLAGPVCETLVFERNGRVQGLVNYNCFFMQGRERVLAAMIALWADDGLTSMQRVRFLGHTCNHLRARGVHIVVAQRSAMMPAAIFLANLFLPIPGLGRLAALWTGATMPLPLPKAWSLLAL